MMTATQWHEADEFWEDLGPIFFEAGRWEAAPVEIDSVVSLLGIEPGVPVLDLCCGPGRHSLELARRGFPVTGVDRTAAFLEIARRDAEGLPVEFVQDDMRQFCRPDYFAVVINLFSSFGYFADQDDDRLALSNMWRSLQPGGALVLELQGREIMTRHLPSRSWVEWPSGFLLEASHLTGDGTWLENRWITITEEGVKEFFWGHRLYTADELSSLLTESGFVDIRLYGDLAWTSYDEAANRLVAVARKPI